MKTKKQKPKNKQLISDRAFRKLSQENADKDVLLQKLPTNAQNFSYKVQDLLFNTVSKYFPLSGKESDEVNRIISVVQVFVAAQDIGISAHTSYEILLKMRKEKNPNKKNSYYEPYRKKMSNPKYFGKLAVKSAKICNDGFEYLNECDRKMRKLLKQHYPLLANKYDYSIPVFGSLTWIKFMETCISAYEVCDKSKIYKFKPHKIRIG